MALSVRDGSLSGFKMINVFTLLGWQRFAGPPAKRETKPALRISWFGILQKSFVMLVLLWITGQVYIPRKLKKRCGYYTSDSYKDAGAFFKQLGAHADQRSPQGCWWSSELVGDRVQAKRQCSLESSFVYREWSCQTRILLESSPGVAAW